MRSNLVSQHVPLRIVTSCVVLLAWAAPAPAQQQTVWPHQFNNKHYAFLGDLAVAFDADSQTPIRQVEFLAADKASVGRFADKDDPFAALIDWPATKHGEHRLSLRFPAEDTQPAQHVLAQRRAIVVTSRNLYLERISRTGVNATYVLQFHREASPLERAGHPGFLECSSHLQGATNDPPTQRTFAEQMLH